MALSAATCLKQTNDERLDSWDEAAADLETLRFLKWQCRIRQDAMRFSGGRPDSGTIAEVSVIRAGESGSAQSDIGVISVSTVLSRRTSHSVVAELEHIAKLSNDPAEWRDKAVRFLSASYYQDAVAFSQVLTATLSPVSPVLAALDGSWCNLVFEACSHRFELRAKSCVLALDHPLRSATLAHNRLFNPYLGAGVVVVGFYPDKVQFVENN